MRTARLFPLLLLTLCFCFSACRSVTVTPAPTREQSVSASGTGAVAAVETTAAAPQTTAVTEKTTEAAPAETAVSPTTAGVTAATSVTVLPTAPATAAPTAAPPNAAPQRTGQPATAAPKTEAPKTAAPTATAAPKTEPPKTEAPKTEAPTAAQPKNVCTVRIECGTILDNLKKLKRGKEAFVPASGVILSGAEVEVQTGDTVFTVLKRACEENPCDANCKWCQKDGVQIEYTFTPGFDTYYVEGIHQLYEMDCGAMSGWMFSVNGKFAEEGASSVPVSPGDTVLFTYTCDMGDDVGNHYNG